MRISHKKTQQASLPNFPQKNHQPTYKTNLRKTLKIISHELGIQIKQNKRNIKPHTLQLLCPKSCLKEHSGTQDINLQSHLSNQNATWITQNIHEQIAIRIVCISHCMT
jgi:hypothetical protein